jgi:hypothetical protein
VPECLGASNLSDLDRSRPPVSSEGTHQHANTPKDEVRARAKWVTISSLGRPTWVNPPPRSPSFPPPDACANPLQRASYYSNSTMYCARTYAIQSAAQHSTVCEARLLPAHVPGEPLRSRHNPSIRPPRGCQARGTSRQCGHGPWRATGSCATYLSVVGCGRG